MSSDNNVFERIFKLWASVCKLILDGKRDAEKVAKMLQEIVDGEVNSFKQNPFLRLLSADPIMIGETDGQQTIAKATDLFTGYIDPDFKNWGLDVSGKAKLATPVHVHELAKDGRFDQFFPTLGNLDDLCLERDQIIKFCCEHRNWLRTEGYSTFFLFKVKGKFFVASVRFDDDGQLRVSVSHFSVDDVWNAEYRNRVVVPQLCQSAA